ncbi:MAG: aminotransferase class I/II-fold pyridoxal phosphate-dependent enzyme [Candidatus Aenigmarchaeota archaeon]|nr:aminotransferase class I/II-fold pyridoxal phosphate-dependent enzyme [Candidatus Aenigmarchaeota archaeon]
MHISERESELPESDMAKLIKIAAENNSVISLGAGEPDFPAPPAIVAYTKKIAGKCSHYSPPEGRRDLREAIAKKMRKENGIRCSPENIIVTSGSQEALLLAAASALDVSEQVIIPSPSFLGYVPMFELLNASPVCTSLDVNFEPDTDDIRKRITSKTEAILINTPSNPTGAVYSRKTLEQIAEIAVEHDLYVFSDEAYEKIVYEGKHVSIGSLNGMQEHVATFQTFSKSYAMCGYRLGYVIAPPKMAAAMKKVHIYSTISAPTISQMLGVKALSQSAYTRKMVKEYDRRRRFIVARLNEMGLPTKMPKGAFYTFSDITAFAKESRSFALSLLKKKKVAVVPGIEFGPGGEGYIRCSYATAYEKIEKAMDSMEDFLKK